MRLFFFCFFISLSFLLADQPKNLIYICIEGLSRDSFYALIQKEKLPNIEKMIGAGNYRSLLAEGPLDRVSRYQVLLTGDLGHQQASLFAGLKAQYPAMNTALLLSYDPAQNARDLLGRLDFLEASAVDQFLPEKARHAGQIVAEAVAYIKDQKADFALFFNFPKPAYIGHKYREGAARYSAAVKACDRALGPLIRALKERTIFEETVFVMTTDYALYTKRRERSAAIWMASSFKTYRFGAQAAIVPSILNDFEIELSGQAILN
eukprot:COSAG01_NODE_2960_length_6792_cov_24.183573_6_plen_264_part_00